MIQQRNYKATSVRFVRQTHRHGIYGMTRQSSWADVKVNRQHSYKLMAHNVCARQWFAMVHVIHNEHQNESFGQIKILARIPFFVTCAYVLVADYEDKFDLVVYYKSQKFCTKTYIHTYKHIYFVEKYIPIMTCAWSKRKLKLAS